MCVWAVLNSQLLAMFTATKPENDQIDELVEDDVSIYVSVHKNVLLCCVCT